MATQPLGGPTPPFNPSDNCDFRARAEAEFRQLARIYRNSVFIGKWKLRQLALIDMLAAPVFTVESLKVKLDAMRGECAEQFVVDGTMTAHQVFRQDAARVARLMG